MAPSPGIVRRWRVRLTIAVWDINQSIVTNKPTCPKEPVMPRIIIFLSVGTLLASSWEDASAQGKKKAAAKTGPKTIVVLPLGMKPGTTEKLTIRGANLEGATLVRFADDAAETKIISKGKASVPDKNPERVGDTQLVVEVTLHEKVTDNPTFVVVTPEGDTKPHPLIVETARDVVKEVEPNDGFRKPHVLKQLPVVVAGSIERPRDVDVFSFAGKKGQKLRVETQAVRFGSAVDPQLTLYRGNALQVDAPTKSLAGDRLLEVELPADDQYHIVLSDANDTGSPIHAYRLIVD
jgi:hypothetical protein